MSHKRKNPPLNLKQLAIERQKHRQDITETMKALDMQWAKFDTFDAQILKFDIMIRGCNETIEHINNHPDEKIARQNNVGYITFFPNAQAAKEQINKDKANLQRDIEALRMQQKLASEKADEYQKRLRGYPTFNEKLDRYNKGGEFK